MLADEPRPVFPRAGWPPGDAGGDSRGEPPQPPDVSHRQAPNIVMVPQDGVGDVDLEVALAVLEATFGVDQVTVIGLVPGGIGLEESP